MEHNVCAHRRSVISVFHMPRGWLPALWKPCRQTWGAYQVAKERYADWVNRGRKPPAHQDFADYVRFAVEKSGADVFFGPVTGLRARKRRWTVVQIDRDRRVTTTAGFHGVVVTGPGPAARTFPKVQDPRVFTGQTFWSKLTTVRRLLKNAKGEIVVIGGGGTAAAIAAWFVRAGLNKRKIVLLNDQATVFTRTTNFFENQIFDDDGAWLSLSEKDRKSFTDRLNRGVVWESVTEVLTDAEQLRLVPGRATTVKHGVHRRGAHRADLVVEYTDHRGSFDLPADLVVDAAGFDAWWFRTLLPDRLGVELRDKSRLDELQRTMREDLSLSLADWPRLHAPMCSQVVGPGFMSLMVLGAMSDRILAPYVMAAMA